MSALVELRRHSRRAAVPLLGALMAVYFGYHGLTGDRSLRTYFRLNQDLAEAKDQLDGARAERQRIEKRVTLLRPESLDPDMLDERVRWTLGYVGPREVVVLQSARMMTPDVARRLAQRPVQ